ncbi:LysR substrate-binding domain-containing protein [Leptolyngbya sp. FACHB-16]|nr:LysR substrate-binding domain-containing protein [Leptolyngbya sp. FACHB-16]MBD1912095.1 LysR family transcriptional regulator [Leptolyngbya sp. FACHB-8]MBD2154986.1 LysR family transcriptional regulator [Leptolyngbya sp. FACHB-16]
MEIYQIKVFLEVARHLSFTDAADVLNLTQPAVSAKIKSLESELGTSVFSRVGRKVELTEVGRFLLEEAPKLIQVENQLLQGIEEIKQGKVGNLKIGCTGAIAEGWLPNILFNYRQKYPEIQTQCVVFESVEALYRAMTDRQVDVGFSDVSSDGSDIHATCIDGIHYSAFVASTHPLAKQSWLSIQDLKQSAWVVLPEGSPSRLVLESRLSELGLSLAAFPRLETVDTVSLMRTYITQGSYVGFASEFDFKLDCQSKNVTAISLQEFALAGNIYLLTSKQLESSNETNLKTQKAIHLNPVQKFVALIQQTKPMNSASGVRLRSPNFLLRDSNPRKPETLTLSIGVQNRTIPAITAGLIMQRLGLLEHFLPKDGRYSNTQYQIRWPDFATGAPIIEGLHSGKLDIGILGDYPLLLSAIQAEKTDAQKTRLVSFVSSNPDGSCNAMIVPNESNLESIEDLRGRVLAVPFHSSAHGMVMRSLQAANLLSDVQLTSLEHPKPSKKFEFPTDLADSYAHFAPFHDVACREGNFRYLCNQRLENLPVFYGVVVRAALADAYPEVVIGYLKALTAAQQWYDKTPAALKLVSQWTRVDPAIVSQTLSTSYHNQPGRFFSETTVRPDWLNLHIQQLTQIPGNECLKAINLNQWVQSDFIQQMHQH